MNYHFASACELEEELPEPKLHKFSLAVRQLLSCDSRQEFLSSEASRDVEDEIWSIIERRHIEVLSFDVFDTYLLRNDKPEAVRFLEMSEYFLAELRRQYPKSNNLQALTAEDFCLARVLGMQATYRTRPLVQGCGEGLIEEVVAMQRNILGLPEEVDDRLLDLEVEYEAENLVANPLLQRLADRFRSKGGKVILVSDMYLGAEHIGKIVRKVVPQPAHDHLYSSADHVISKRSGRIFSMVEKELDVEGARILHMGDSWLGDVRKPRNAGWNAFYFPISESEKRRRLRALEEFIYSMDAKGIETRPWAKV